MVRQKVIQIICSRYRFLLKLLDCLIEFSLKVFHLLVAAKVDSTERECRFERSHIRHLNGNLHLVLLRLLRNFATARHFRIDGALVQDFRGHADYYHVNFLSFNLRRLYREIAFVDFSLLFLRLDDFERVYFLL